MFLFGRNCLAEAWLDAIKASGQNCIAVLLAAQVGFHDFIR